MSARKVLYVIAQLGSGGTESQLLHLVRRIDRSRFEPEIATFTAGGTLSAAFAAECPVHTLPKRPIDEPKVMGSLCRLIRKLRPSILHTCLFPANWRGCIAGRLSRVPVVIGSVRNVSTWMGPSSRLVERSATWGADAVIVNAPAVGRYMVDVVRVRADRLRLIPNGVDTTTFRPRREGDIDVRSAIWGGERVEVIGSVMSLTGKKNPRMLVEAARRVVEVRPSARFVLAGEGPLRGSIEEWIASSDLHGKFRLLGFRDDTPDLIRSFDVLALTSDREGMPNIVLEAMATGIPVAGTAVGGTVDLVREEETGKLVPPGDASALADALLSILRDREAASRMGEAARRIVRADFAMERMVERTMGLYDELLSRGARESVARPAGAAERSQGVLG